MVVRSGRARAADVLLTGRIIAGLTYQQFLGKMSYK